jgi:hypothetical protein
VQKRTARNIQCRPAFSGKWRELVSRPSLDWGTDLLCATIAYEQQRSE